ncbi:hypothetical protein E2C01_033427 [Portunus trituberculatus]|uniref:Uncharacterized protein n=1 Tax=Portunus trituberculatus TaxID=210409 RepID=A0A5B7F2E7_PORTR|nr:hypothetical protein [Portunus trituberculatus]
MQLARSVEQTSGEVREAGLGVLRGLAAAVGSSEEFREHLHLHLLAALIHLADPHPPTVVVLDLKDHIGFFIQATSSYFKSPEPSLRKAAALLIEQKSGIHWVERLDNTAYLEVYPENMVLLLE